MMKQYIKLLVALLVILLIYFYYSLYQDKKMYEEHISIDVSNDMSDLVTAILRSNEFYENILNEGSITRYDAEMLKMNAYTIQEVPQTYGSLALKFNRIKSDEFHNETAEQAAQIASFFSEMHRGETSDKDNPDEVIFELDDSMEEKIFQLKDLNSLWMDSVKNNVHGISDNDGEIGYSYLDIHNQYGDKSLSHDFWVDLIISIDKNTRSFLSKNSWTSIEDMLQN